MSSNKPFILAFRPHQMPAWAYAYESEDEFVSDWAEGAYDHSCSCNNSLSEEDRELTYENAFDDVRHDLYCLTRLDSADDVTDYLNNYSGHNKGTHSIIEAASRLGWVEVDLD